MVEQRFAGKFVARTRARPYRRRGGTHVPVRGHQEEKEDFGQLPHVSKMV
jgi:hypothetical protein